MADRFDNWDKFIDPRIDELKKCGFYLESFYLCLTTIEHLLQTCIHSQEDWVATLLKKSKINFVPTSEEILKEKTLGELIKIFSKYCDDNLLISELNSFNSFRKTIVHKLLDQDLSVLNQTAKQKLTSYHRLVLSISRYGMKISQKHIKSHTRKIKMIDKKLKQHD